MRQEAEKIYNIEHAENVNIHIDGLLFESIKKLSQAEERFPGLIESTIAMLFEESNSYKPSDNRLITPAALKNKRKGSYGVGDVVLSHWQIDKCIGRGSIGSVYAAHHIAHGDSFKSAIKIINSDLLYSPIGGKDDISHTTIHPSYKVQQELDSMVELRGTGYIVDYEDHERISYDDDSWGFIIRMELLNPFPGIQTEDEAIGLGIDICKALEFCHKSGIIHCDVKPSNIYLTKWGGYKLGDFSASVKFTNHQERDRIGTLKYMAPEVFVGEPLSPAIDIYSLGLVLYELLKINRLPPVSREKALSQRLSGKPLPPIPGLSKPLQSIILKACAYKPEDRFSSATEMLDELMRVNKRRRR